MSLLLGLVLVLGLPQADKTYLLQYKPVLNKVYRYDVETTSPGPQPGVLKLVKLVKATKVEAGNVTVETRFDSVSIGIAPPEQVAQSERLIKATVVTQTFDSRMRVVSSDATRFIDSFLIGGLDALYAVAYPPEAVKVGDSWTSEVEHNGSKLGVILRLNRVFIERRREVADLRMESIGPSGVKSVLPLTVVVDMATGVLQRLEFVMPKLSAGLHVVIRLR